MQQKSPVLRIQRITQSLLERDQSILRSSKLRQCIVPEVMYVYLGNLLLDKVSDYHPFPVQSRSLW